MHVMHHFDNGGVHQKAYRLLSGLMFCMQAPSDVLWESSYLWAIQAHRASLHRSRLSIITLGLQQPIPSPQISMSPPSMSAVLGCARTLFQEDRAAFGSIIDVWPATQLPNLHILQAVLETTPPEYSLALHHGQIYAERIFQSPQAAEREGGEAIKGITTVVSGGTKGLGLSYARQAALDGTGCMVLASRNPALSRESLTALAASGTAVFIVRCDTAETQESSALVHWSREHLPAVQIFAHAAGNLGYDLIPEITPASFESLTKPKVTSAAMFSEADQPLLATALFSTTASIWSQTGAAHYSAANSILDSTAGAAQAAGVFVSAVNFGPFAGVGMAAAHVDSMHAIGLASLQPPTAYRAFRAVGYAPHTIRAGIKVGKFVKVNTAKGPWPLLHRLASISIDKDGCDASSLSTVSFTAPSSTKAAARNVSLLEITSMVRSAAEETSGHDVTSNEAFAPASFDSLSAVELADRISKAVGRDLPSTLVFDYPSVTAIADYVYSILSPSLSAVDILHQLSSGSSTDRSIQDIQLQFSDRTPQLTQASGSTTGSCMDSISTVMYSRWVLDGHLTTKSSLPARFGGFIDGVEDFDAATFSITPAEALLMDPQQRLLLEVCIDFFCQFFAFNE